MADRIGQHLGNYHLRQKLGQGGFAEVYLGEHLFLGTTLAIKVLHTQIAQTDVAEFQQEARILAGLKHPHIVRILDFGLDGQTPYLVMDYAPHGTLRTRHPKGTVLPVATVVEYVKQIAQALQYAHDSKVIHRDIKPENMLIGKQNEILLSDFGIALIAQSSRNRSTLDMVGTIAYMAPEQIAGHPHIVSDEYALGIMAYEWLCGTRPFHGSFTEIAIQHSITPPPPLRKYLPDLSPEIELVILTALAKRPEDRFASVRAFANAFEQASQSFLPTEQARSAPFSPQLLPSETPVPPPATATLLATSPDLPVDTHLTQAAQSISTPVSSSHTDLPMLERAGLDSPPTSKPTVSAGVELPFQPNLEQTHVDNESLFPRPDHRRRNLLAGLVGGLVVILAGSGAAIAFTKLLASSCSSSQTSCNGICTNIKNDSKNCGSCGNACRLGENCVSGTCCFTCNGICKDLQNDSSNCGSCGNACQSNSICRGGTCECIYETCGSVCCQSGYSCAGGMCCPSGQKNCNGTCMDTSVNHDHCGSCNAYCGPTSTCIGGTCHCIYASCTDGCCHAAGDTCCSDGGCCPSGYPFCRNGYCYTS